MGIWIPIVMMVLAYLVGSIPFGLIIGKFKGIDIREKGSHNIGATNVFRTIGPWYGVLVFILDALKSAIFVILFRYIIPWNDSFFHITSSPTYLWRFSNFGSFVPNLPQI